MRQTLPSAQDIDLLLSFLPKLYAVGAQTFTSNPTEEPIQENVVQIGSPNYSDVVYEFFAVAGRPVWNDRDYVNKQVGEVLSDPRKIATASLQDMKTLLTFCVRGERFCDGYWGDLVDGGQIRLILNRLAELRQAIK
jgi:hypothetical protein